MRFRLMAGAALLALFAAGSVAEATGPAQVSSLQISGGMGGSRKAPPPREVETVTRGLITYASAEAPGTIIVNTGERRLYLLLGDGKALSYAVGVGRDGFIWTGRNQVSR